MSELQETPSEAEEREREILADAFRFVLSQPSGKRVLFWILERCAIYSDAYTGDNNATNYTLGLQSAGRRIIAQLDQIDPRLYPKLLTDMANLKIEDEAAAKRAAQPETEDDETLDG